MKTKPTTLNNLPTKFSQRHWLATIVFLCAAAGWSHAQSAYTWNGGSGTTGNWSDGANWGGSGPASPQAFLNFNGAARTSSTNDFSGGSAGYQIYFKSGANTFNLYGNSITFYDFGGGDPNIQNEGAFTNQIISFPIVDGNNNGVNGILNINLNSSTAQGPLTFNGPVTSADANVATRAINVSGSNTVTFNGVISDFSSSGKIALTQLGSGTTTLFATNLFTGGLTISAGTVALGDSGLLGNGAYAGAIGNSGAFVVNSTNAQTLSGNITGAGTLTKNGTNILTLSGANNYSGLTTNTGGTILYSGAGGNSGNGPYGLSTGSSLTLNSSGTVTASAIWLTRNSATADPVINLQSGTLTVGSGGITNFVGTTGNAVINLGGGTLKSAATFNIANAIVINITNSSTIDTTGGNITNASSFVAGAANNGTLTIQGGNSLTAQDNHSGSTIITGNSTLRQLAASSPTGTLTVNTGSTLDLNTFALGAGALSGGGTIDTVAGGTPTLTVGSVNGNSLFSGLIKNTAGTLALTVTNPSATLTLSGANNTFGGTVNIGNGTVNLRSGVIRAAATQTLGTGAVTVGNGGNESTGRLELSNSISLNNYINLSQRNNSSVSIENISGNNNLTGTIGLTTGGSIAIIQSDAGLLTLGTASSTIISNQIAASTRIVTLSGAGNGTVAGNIIDSGTAVMALTKDGAGTWTLNGADTFSGDTRITNGTLTLGNTLALQSSTVDMNALDSGTLNLNSLNATLGGLKGARNLALGTGTISIGSNGVANTYSGSLSGTAMNKVGFSAWTLSGTNTFAGTTAVNLGELVGSTLGSLSNSVITVNAGATNGVILASANGQFTCGGLTFNAGTTYADFNFNGIAPSTTTAPLQVKGNLTFTLTPNVIVRSANSIISPGTYPLIKYTGTLSGTPPATLFSGPAGLTATIVNNTANKSIDLNVTIGNFFTWAVGNAAWDINTTASWKNTSGSTVNYLDGSVVQFDDTASGTTPITVNVAATVSPSSLTFSNVTKNYTLTNAGISGAINLTKLGNATLTLATNNSFTSGVNLGGGTLVLGSSSAAGTGAITLSNGVTLTVGISGNVTPANAANVAAGANVTFTANGIGSGLNGNITSGDSASVITTTASTTFGGTLSGFTGTLTVSGGTTRFSNGANGATTLGSAAANFIVNSTAPGIQPRNNNTTVNMGSLSGAGTLGAAQTPAGVNSSVTTYSIGALNTSTTFAGKFSDSLGGANPTTNIVAVTKIGTGTLSLSGNSIYSGATTINAGTLLGVTGGSVSNSSVTVNSGATNGVTITTPGNQWTCTNLTYTAAGTEYALFAFGANTPSTTIAPLLVQNNLAISGTLNILISGGSTTIPVGTYPLIKYNNTLTGTPPAVPLSLPQYVNGIITNDTANKLIALIVTNVITPKLTWLAGTGTWETNSLNWTNNILGGLTNWSDGYLAQFDDTATGAGPFTVTLTNNVNPLGVLFTNNTKNYTLTGNGSVTGNGTLTKAGSGTLVLATTNTSAGGIVVSGGTLQGSAGTLLGNIVNSAALVFDQSVSASNNAVISGSGSLTKQNSGTLALGGNNTYTGKTFVNAGTLAISAGANVGGNPGVATPDQITLNGATLLATNGAATITLPTNAGLTVTNTATIDVAAGITLDYPAQAISGIGTLVKNGAGTFQMDEGNASSTYTNLILNNGTIAFNKSSGGLGAGSLVINGGLIRTTGASSRTPNNPFVFVNGDFTLGSPTTAAISFASGGAWTLANGTRTITVDTIVATITGVVGDGGNNLGLNKAGSGTLILSVADTYTGPTTNLAGNLKLANNLAAGTNAITSAGTVQIANGVTIANAFTANQTFESLDVPDAGAVGTYSGTVSCPSTAQFRFMASGAGAFLVLSNATANLGARFIYPTRGNIVYAGNSTISSSSGSLIGRSTGNPASLLLKDTASASFSGGFAMGNSGGINSSVALTLQDSASLTTGTSGFDFLGTTVAASSVSLNGGTLAVGSFFKTAANAETL